MDSRADALAPDALADEDATADAVDRLAAVNRRESRPDLEIELVDLRARAAAAYDPGSGRTPWPPVYADPFPDVAGRLPEVDAHDLTTDILGGAVAHHGSLIVRRAFGADQVARSLDVIEHAHEIRSREETTSGSDAGDLDEAAWYRPMPTPRPRDVRLRKMVADQGGTWLADSPRGTAAILDELDQARIIGAVRGHLGERPFFSLQKSTLRRSIPFFRNTAWHQDGSFLHPEVRTMNTWVALSRCGGSHPTPGLEIIPRRMPGILPVDGVMSPHSISYELVGEFAAETPTVVPEFAPGDAIMFDEQCLHRTHLTPTMTDIRYALEFWFFAPSHPSPDYTPLLV